MKSYLFLFTISSVLSAVSGCQLEAKDKEAISKPVDQKMLQGKWMQIINREGFDPEGYIFKAKGALEDINHLGYRTDSWLLSGDTLKLTIRTNADKNAPMTVFYKVNMVDDQLILSSFDPEVNYREVYTKTK